MIRSVLAVLAGAAALIVVVAAATLGWLKGDFPGSAPGLVGLLAVEVVAGVLGATMSAWLAPRSPAIHGWVFGAIVFVLNVVTVTTPDTAWPLVPGLLLLGLVPPQTWIGVRLGTRLRRSREGQTTAR